MTDKEFELLLRNAASELGADYIDPPEGVPPHTFPAGYKEKIMSAARQLTKPKILPFRRFVKGFAAMAALVAISVGVVLLVRNGLPSQSDMTQQTAKSSYEKNDIITETEPSENIAGEQDAAENIDGKNKSEDRVIPDNTTKYTNEVPAANSDKQSGTSSSSGMSISVQREGRYVSLSENQLEKLETLTREMIQSSELVFDAHTAMEDIEVFRQEGTVITAEMSNGQVIHTDGVIPEVSKLVLYIRGREGYVQVYSGETNVVLDISAEKDLIDLIEKELS